MTPQTVRFVDCDDGKLNWTGNAPT